MKLAELLEAYPYSFPGDLPDAEISSLEYDSRKAGTGSLFFCLPGARADGHDFA
ncbi:MAG: UDP-N-acetylmuramoyl-L-alanyl-D-glutamate--2,6-diaminopimelate ligase, partial [Clostridia bacterium]|nr:UDP-N-acetylmuramoyl-L-alanyl-D-glutamate--2,6-diaminopimelate ligase [Clostridia bacterium]